MWEPFFSLLPRLIEGRLIWFHRAERYWVGCIAGGWYEYRLPGSSTASTYQRLDQALGDLQPGEGDLEMTEVDPDGLTVVKGWEGNA